jgi:hypothetical protein
MTPRCYLNFQGCGIRLFDSVISLKSLFFIIIHWQPLILHHRPSLTAFLIHVFKICLFQRADAASAYVFLVPRCIWKYLSTEILLQSWWSRFVMARLDLKYRKLGHYWDLDLHQEKSVTKREIRKSNTEWGQYVL